MFPLPAYWRTRPPYELDPVKRKEFEDLLETAQANGLERAIDYSLETPRWQFLCYCAEELRLALHGSTNRAITRFEPRQAQDLREFGAQNAVYAAADGIWPMYFAIVDRQRVSTALVNAAVQIENPDGTLSPRYYHFSLDRKALQQGPYTTGMVYLLPRETFHEEEPLPFGDFRVRTFQLVSPEPVVPLAKLEVRPEDFPFLGEMMAHEDERLEEYANALQNGLPWPGSSE